MGVFGWIQWVAISAAVLAVVGLATKLYFVIRENGENRIVIETQQLALEHKDSIIQSLKDIQDLQNRVITEQMAELQELEQKYENLASDLGPGEDDPAPEPLKELFRRLQ